MWAWISSHRTRLIGGAVILFGILQLNLEQFKNLIPEKDRGMALIVAGLVIVLIGHTSPARFEAWILRHKTALIGYAAIAFGGLEKSFDSVKDLIPEQYRGISLVVLGIGVSVIGQMNAGNPPST